MRGEDRTSRALFSYVDVEARIPAKRPLRAMRRVTNAALAELDAAFLALYEGCGRPSVPPERRQEARKRRQNRRRGATKGAGRRHDAAGLPTIDHARRKRR